MRREDQPEFCRCGCHRPGSGMIHIRACCHQCRYCGRRVAIHVPWFDYMTSHEANCEPAIRSTNTIFLQAGADYPDRDIGYQTALHRDWWHFRFDDFDAFTFTASTA